jgi:hypothetical protein
MMQDISIAGMFLFTSLGALGALTLAISVNLRCRINAINYLLHFIKLLNVCQGKSL